MFIHKIAIISPYARSITMFRGHLISKLVDRGIHVFVLAPDYTPELRKEVRHLGAETIDYSLERTGINPLEELRGYLSLMRALREVKPDAVLGYTHKPVIYGLLAGRFIGINTHYALITGLGYAFTPSKESGIKHKFIRVVLRVLYRVALPGASKVFFQNKDDLEEFERLGLVKPRQAIVSGASGIDLQEWRISPPKIQPITFTLAARLLKEKGVMEFAEAARLVKKKYPRARFLLLGGLDSNPGAISERTVQRWVNEGVLEWLGHVKNMKSYLAETSVFVLPSYREGVPRSTQEAMAMARPIISTDVPGCRETVLDTVNGFLVSPREPDALAEAMERFIREPGLIERMGCESRRLAEERFDVEKINTRLIEEMLLASNDVFMAKRFNHHN